MSDSAVASLNAFSPQVQSRALRKVNEEESGLCYSASCSLLLVATCANLDSYSLLGIYTHIFGFSYLSTLLFGNLYLWQEWSCFR